MLCIFFHNQNIRPVVYKINYQCNAAHALGLGTVVVGWFDHDKAADILGLPGGYELVSLIPAGYPDQKGSSPKRREIKDFIHENIF
ncbi:nitroreductase family protein [Desulforapulum autotrophicum]|uniref:nitroreductase family protein n=1 Tax=Desulforapulum autotrophicum TaxID=2296 RepID=UPI0009FBCB9B